MIELASTSMMGVRKTQSRFQYPLLHPLYLIQIDMSPVGSPLSSHQNLHYDLAPTFTLPLLPLPDAATRATCCRSSRGSISSSDSGSCLSARRDGCLELGSTISPCKPPPITRSYIGQTYNSLNQSPCQTAAYLAAQCNNGRTFILIYVARENLIDTSPEYTIQQIPQGSHYTGPSGSDDGDICRCNSVYYSLISACVGCQKGVWIPYVLVPGISCLDSQ